MIWTLKKNWIQVTTWKLVSLRKPTHSASDEAIINKDLPFSVPPSKKILDWTSLHKSFTDPTTFITCIFQSIVRILLFVHCHILTHYSFTTEERYWIWPHYIFTNSTTFIIYSSGDSVHFCTLWHHFPMILCNNWIEI